MLGHVPAGTVGTWQKPDGTVVAMVSGTRGWVVTAVAVATLAVDSVSASSVGSPPGKAAAVVDDPGVTTLLSASTDGQVANGACKHLMLSGSGQYAVFECAADNLVPGDTNGSADIYLRDRDAGTTTRVSVSSTGAQANDHSLRPSISTYGTWVAFDSAADNLVPGDRNGVRDVFAHNRRTGKTKLVSVDQRGRPASRRSFTATVVADGPKIVFVSRARLSPQDTDRRDDVYLHSARTGRTQLLTSGQNPLVGDEDVQQISVAVKSDGLRIGFLTARPLVPADRNRHRDAYWYDAETREYRLVSANLDGRSAAGRPGASQMMLSPDGVRVAFTSSVNDLVVDDRFPGADVFVRNVRAGTTRLVSVDALGGPANGPSRAAGIHRDGRYVAFSSMATNLDPGDDPATEDVFVRDLSTGTTRWASAATDGTPANGHSTSQSDLGLTLSGFCARFVGFESWATNLTTPGPASVPQLYVRDRGGCPSGRQPRRHDRTFSDSLGPLRGRTH